MIKSKKKWVIQRPNDQIVQQFQKELSLSTIAAKVLAARGCQTIEQARSFLLLDETQLHDPFLLHGMQEAVTRIQRAITQNEKILIYGDYDCDGITSTTVMLTVLQHLGADVSYVIPNRFTHGYGPNKELFEQAYADGVSLIVTVDNGISGIEQIARAKELGLDVIVTDHHEPGDVLPKADVIVHPRIPEGHYPFGELAGVGVAFKLAHALYGEVPEHLLEYVALGTIADLVPLLGENRYLVKRGLQKLKKSDHLWVKELCNVSGVKQAVINEESVGFYFAPRLNAIGRLGDAMPGVQFLTSTDLYEAQKLANELNEQNSERKAIVNAIVNEAIAMVESDETFKNSSVLVLAKEGWNPGVVGIVASRLVEQYYKPTFILSIDAEKGVAKGSARSIEGFHLYDEIAKNKDIVPHFGGHPMAAGMTLPIDNVQTLRERLNEQATSCLTNEQLMPTLHIDVPVQLNEITVAAIEEIEKLSPFGTEFSKPLFCIENVKPINIRKIGAQETHLKLELDDSYDSIDAIGFGKGYLFNEISYDARASFVGDLQINEWQGNKKPQFMIQDVVIDEWQLFDLRGKSQTANWLTKIPKDGTSFIAFQEETAALYKPVLKRDIVIVTEVPRASLIRENIVLLDLPKRTELLETLLTCRSFARIYAHFYTASSQYFNGMPTREHFKWYYTFLKKRPTFNLNEHIIALSQHIGLNIDVIKFMTDVFFELGFVKIENGFIDVVENAPNRALTDAVVYKQRQQQIELEQKLLYATYIELKQWFHERMQVSKEEV